MDLPSAFSPEALAELFEAAGLAQKDETASDLLQEYLDLCALGEDENERQIEIAPGLILALDGLRVDANGGSRRAREERDAILVMLEEAIEAGSLVGPDLMMIGKILFDAGWTPPEGLKRAIAESFDDSGPDSGPADASEPDGGAELANSLLALSEELENDEFALCAQLSSVLAAFPAELARTILARLVDNPGPTIDLALAGFVLHRDPALAEAAMATLAGRSGRAVDSLLVERLVRTRAWLRPERLAPLDAAIRALRPLAGDPVKREADEPLKAYMSACDGSGAHNLAFVTRRARKRHVLVALVKPAGVAEVVMLDDLGTTEADAFVAQMRASAETAETDLAGALRMLELALADNLESGAPPPYELVGLAERIGLGPLTPRAVPTTELIAEILSDATPVQTDEAAVLRAHKRVVESPVAANWFEAGPQIEDLLFPVRPKKRRADVVLKSYLPQRREYWARNCVLTALSLSGPAGARPSPFRHDLALIARDLLSGKPLESLPLMQTIAGTTVEAFRHNAESG